MAERAAPPPTHRVIATAGHVDHGKSTLLRALTGMEPDRLDEERRRGLTIDLGYAWTDLPAAEPGGTPTTVAFVDVPGHTRFVSTMLAGAGAAPAALPVVAADDGWSRQSAEHRDVLDLLGIPAVAVVVTKADLVDEERIEAVVAEITRELADTSLAGAPIVVTDAISGRGLDRLRRILTDRLAVLPAPVDIGRPRLWIDRSFSIGGAGTVVTGTLTDGAVSHGDELLLLPSGTRARVRGLQALGAAVQRAPAGTRVAINLAGVDHTEVVRGDVAVGGGPWRTTTRADLWLQVLPGATIQRTGAWHLHVGSASTTTRVLPLVGSLVGDRTSNEGGVRVLLDAPLPLVSGDRVVLRDAGRRAVVAGGVVADPAPLGQPRGRRARETRAAALRELAGLSRPRRLAALAALTGGSRDADRVRASAGWPADDAAPEGLLTVGTHLVLEAVRDAWIAAVRTLGPGTHDRATVSAAALDAGAHREVASAVADHLVDAGVLVRISGGYALPEHVDAATSERRRRADAVIERLAAEPFAPPDLGEVAREVGLEHRELAALVQSGDVVRCGKVAFARTAVTEAAARLRELGRGGRSFTAAEAKEAWGTSRRFAIPLLEHLDRTGLTVFDGQFRQLTVTAEQEPGSR